MPNKNHLPKKATSNGAQKLKIHFIGIGGIGVSALAKYYLAKGHVVSGSDLTSSEITETLEKMGAKIFIGQQTKNNVPKKVNLIIYSPAVKPDNPELVGQNRASTISYPEALAKLAKDHFTIAVSGTHGKSTTCSMLGLILIKAGFDPTVIVGTKVKEFGNSNCRIGKSKYLVIEACEYEDSFLNYKPNIILITNVEAEHLDYFKNFSNVKKAFKKFAGNLVKSGVLIDGRRIFANFSKEKSQLEKILKVPGKHNIENALLALLTARALKIPDKKSLEALSKFKGTWRRFEIRKKGQLTIVSDYGHHPTEVKATLTAAREKWPARKIWCIFQPHQYQRTHSLFDDFIKVFSKAPINRLIITDIYDVAGREEKSISQKTSSKKLIESINKKSAIYLPKDKIIGYLKKKLKGREVIIIMGAGDIYEVDKAFK
ncbi:MAG: Mur ligase domain-containing protein [Candidatus Nealsonbacteria bacterium]|nr:Mur ligase domain-containing protein [Candidatus Nealsonbacteria bacterium]